MAGAPRPMGNPASLTPRSSTLTKLIERDTQHEQHQDPTEKLSMK